MSEIEKLYENAGVQSFKTCEFCTQKNIDCLKENISNITCGLSKDAYPSFTAEKQLELIKWLCQKTYRNYLLIKYNFTNYYWQIECNMIDSDKLDNFAGTIASMINNLWQDLTDAEKAQIKNILESEVRE